MGIYSSNRFTGIIFAILGFLCIQPTYCLSQGNSVDTQIWYAQAGADGDGSKITSPLGTTSDIEKAASNNDIIFLLPGEQAFEGGITLKKGQSLIGLVKKGQLPVITNSESDRNNGNGLVLSDNNHIQNLHIQSTYASGIYGYNSTNNHIVSVHVDSANLAGAYTRTRVKLFGQPLSHGGILFINDQGRSTQNYISNSLVLNSKAFGIVTLAAKGSIVTLTVDNTKISGGDRLGNNDIGFGSLSQDTGTRSQIVLNNVTVKDRRSRAGRNVLALATSGASNQMNIHKSTVGYSGQDGVIAIAALLPASVDLDIVGSTLENADQMNVEGTILNLPAFDSSRVQETIVDINIQNSIVRNAGKRQGFGTYSRNIWLGATDMAQQLDPDAQNPYQGGRYKLVIENSTVTGALDYGIGLGQERSPNNIGPEKNIFDVQLRNNTVYNNGKHALVIGAPNVQLDASDNCWHSKQKKNEEIIRFAESVNPFTLNINRTKNCK